MRNKIKFKLRLRGDMPITIDENMPVKVNIKEGFFDKIGHLIKNEQLVVSIDKRYKGKSGAFYVTGYISYIKPVKPN